MAHRKSAHTDKGQGVGKIAQQHLEQLEQSLGDEHSHAALDFLRLLLHNGGERLLEKHHKERNHKHHHQNHGGRKGFSAHVEHDGAGQGEVEYQARHAVGVKVNLLRVVGAQAVDDVKHHTHENDQHAQAHGHHKHGVQLADKRQVGHRLGGPQPHGRNQILKPEHAAEQQAEDGGEHAAAGDDSRKADFLKPVEQEPADEKAQPLARVPEHEAEQEGVGQADENGGVDLVVARQAVHFHIQFKRFKQPRVLHLGGRLAHNVRVVVLDDTEGIVVVFNLLLEASGILLRHPAAQNVEGVVVVFGAGRQLAHVEVGGKGADPLIGGNQVVLAAVDGGHDVLIHLENLRLQLPDLILQVVARLGGCAVVLVRQEHALKMHGRVDGVDLVLQLFRHKVHDPDVLVVLLALKEDGVDGVVNVRGEFLVILS